MRIPPGGLDIDGMPGLYRNARSGRLSFCKTFASRFGCEVTLRHG